MDFKGKKVLVVGLGTLGGGLATVKWLLAHGANVTVTDLREHARLKDSIRALGNSAGRVRFVLGKHTKKDFVSHEAIVVNPAVRIQKNPFLSLARKKGIPILNDLVVFLENAKNPIIAVTGTRGKTTTANWVAHFLSGKKGKVSASGNSSDHALLKLLPRLEKKRKIPAVLELSSFQLEIAKFAHRAPNISIITNLYRDHLNRHQTMEKYADAKANIFMRQDKTQNLILNYDNAWTAYFLRKKPKSRIYLISLENVIPRRYKHFLIRANKKIVFSDGERKINVFSKKTLEKIELLGKHNMYNFLCSALAAHLAGVSWKEIESRAQSLPVIPYRQEVIIEKKNMRVINDTTATSPEGGIVALARFGGKNTIFIAGGTDKKLDYTTWAKEVKKKIDPQNLFLLDGSATRKMISALIRIGYFKNTRPRCFEDLKKLLQSVKKFLNINRQLPVIILFSPSSASFEKFKNEFDRGEKFGKLSKKIFA